MLLAEPSERVMATVFQMFEFVLKGLKLLRCLLDIDLVLFGREKELFQLLLLLDEVIFILLNFSINERELFLFGISYLSLCFFLRLHFLGFEELLHLLITLVFLERRATLEQLKRVHFLF